MDVGWCMEGAKLSRNLSTEGTPTVDIAVRDGAPSQGWWTAVRVCLGSWRRAAAWSDASSEQLISQMVPSLHAGTLARLLRLSGATSGAGLDLRDPTGARCRMGGCSQRAAAGRHLRLCGSPPGPAGDARDPGVGQETSQGIHGVVLWGVGFGASSWGGPDSVAGGVDQSVHFRREGDSERFQAGTAMTAAAVMLTQQQDLNWSAEAVSGSH